MIQVTITHKNDVELTKAMTLAIDPEKIVNTKDRDGYVIIEYGETYDRRDSNIFYQLNTDRATINALIQGDYVGKQYLSLNVYKLATGDTFALDLLEQYIVYISDAVYQIGGARTECVKIEYDPGAFAPIIIYADTTLDTLVPTVAGATTTTTTATPNTTTTTVGEQQ